MENTQSNSVKTAMVYPILLSFLCMGFGDAVGPLVGLVKTTFSLSYFSAQLLSFSGFIMFGVLSIALGLLQDRKGKKYILLLGLIVAFVGLLLPILNGMYGPKVVIDASAQYKFYILLIAILFLGAGNAILQVAGNPIMKDVSKEGQYSSNLSLAQTIKAIGSSLGFLLPPFVVYMFGLDWSILFPVFAVMILLTCLWVFPMNIKEKKDPNSQPATMSSCLKLLANPYVLMMVMGIFVYVGAEVSMSSGVPMLLKEQFHMEKIGLLFSWALFFLPILIGRFTGSLILKFVSASRFLVITVLISLVGIVMLLMGSEIIVFAGIILVGLGFANIFPLIFSITIDKMPDRSNELSGLMVTAIVGGAFIPPIMGAVADSKGILVGFCIPMICILYILFSAFVSLKSNSIKTN